MCRWGKGDAAATDAAFARAAHVTALAIRSPRQIVHYMETRAAWSAYDPADDVVTVTFSSQGVQIPHRLMCEKVLNLPKEKLRLVTEDVGGGFGPKYPITAELTLIAWATRKLRRGLRWTCERAELAQSDSHARDLLASAELALDADGKFLGLRVKAQANYGAYVSMFAPTIPTTGLAKVISGLYRIPAIRIDFDCAFTNTVPVDAIRGAGKPEALFLLERLLDIAAHETGRTPAELRRLNLLKADDMPYVAASGYTYDAADCARLFETALSAADEPGFVSRRANSEAAGKLRGLGFSCHLHGTGGIADEHAVVEVEPDRLVATGRHPEPGPGPRNGLRPDPVRVAGRAGRAHRDPPGRYAHHPARRRHRRLLLHHHQRHDAAARRRRGDPARPRPRGRAAGDGAGRHRLSRRQLRGFGHRPPHRPVRAGGQKAVRG